MNGAERMQITIHRGTAEVGGTMIELNSGKTRILLDAGYPLFYRGELIADERAKKPYQELLELGVIPKVKGLYRWDDPEFDAVLISHAHSDHFGLLRYIHPSIPVYLSETTDKLIDRSLAFPIRGYSRRDRRLIKMYEPFSIGDFTVKPYLMDHSAFQAAAFEIKCGGKALVYTGDFRGHGRRREYLERFLAEAEKEPDLLLIEGTTLGRTGEPEAAEEALVGQFKEVMENSRGIVLCQPASQNIDRIITIHKAALACGKTLVLDGYTAGLLKELKKLGHEGLPVPSLFRPDVRVLPDLNHFGLCSIFRGMIRLRQKQIVMLVRPSMLPELKRMRLENGVRIYSQWQVYRQKPQQVRLDKYLASRGFEGCYLHTSGHAFEEDIKKVITGLSPKEIVPIHTFCPEAFHQFHSNVTLRKDGVPFLL